MISLKNNKYIGDRQFYKRAMSVAIPLMIQNVVTNLVNVLDNVMVGTVGTEAMSGVSIVNQFIFIFNLMIFGSVSASGIFTAQYHGKNDTEGVRYTFRFKLLASLLVALVGIAVFRLAHAPIINSFLYNGSTEGDLALTFEYGRQYLFIMLVGLIPWALSQSYASTMRETGDATVPMIASTVAVITNVVLNAILIFGLFGMPALNVVGAAVATVVSRFIELIILAVNVHVRREVYPFGKGTFVNFRIPLPLVREIIIKGLPVMLNEFLWATAITARNSCYATRGLDVVAALNIASTVGNLFSVVYMSLGSAMAIIVGNKLGAGEIEDAKDTARKMLAFSLAASVLMALVLGATAPFFPHIYNTSSAVRSLATYLILVLALVMPMCAYAFCTYFILRSGGRVYLTLLFDSLFVWTVTFPLAYILSRFTGLEIHTLYLLCQLPEALKVVFGVILMRKVEWARKIVK